VRDLIGTLRSEGITVFLNSHLLSEVERVCDRVAFVNRGQVVQAGRLDDLLAESPRVRVTVNRVDRELLHLLARHGDVLEVDGTSITLGVADLDVAPLVAEAVIQAGYRLHGLVPTQSSLEDLFVSLVEGGDR
jgi:ABC-2 type transport system ATP-binding protein